MTLLLFAAALAPAHAKRAPEPLEPPTPPIEIVPEGDAVSLSPGSMFSDVAVRRLMGMDGNARQVGDLVTVVVAESSSTTLAAQTETSRKSEYQANLRKLLGIEKRILKAHQELEDIGVDFGSESSFSGAGNTSRDSNVEAVITCQIIDVLPGGNLRVWGWKQVQVNRETQFVILDGIVRPRDIQMDNTVSSDLLAQARIEFTGTGVVSDRQGPGWFARILDTLWPF